MILPGGVWFTADQIRGEGGMAGCRETESGLKSCQTSDQRTVLLHRDRLCEIPGLVYVCTLDQGNVIGEQLQGNNVENR